MSNYTSRRTYLLNRAAWILVGVAVIYLIWGNVYVWPVVIVSVLLAALGWFTAGSIEKKRRNRHAQYSDEQGNIRPTKL